MRLKILRCPKHDLTLFLRLKKEDDTLAVVCPLCDGEGRDGATEDVEVVRPMVAEGRSRGRGRGTEEPARPG